MPEATKQLLQTVAVIGREVPLRLLCAVCSEPGSLVVRPVGCLVELGPLTSLCGLGFLRPADECRLADRHAEPRVLRLAR
jgi:hypothetical protein